VADFEKSHKRTGGSEAGYSNHKKDKGKETFAGVSRKFHPDWQGWKIVDENKIKCTINGKLNVKKLNKILFSNPQMIQLLYDFYKKEYWDINRLNEIDSQLLADNIFDAGVNCGKKTSIRFLQRAINTLSQNDIIVDGIIGNQTLKLANNIDYKKLVDEFLKLRIQYHKEIVKNDPEQKVFLKNWLNRCELMRKEVV
jgi:lysozyme family protein